MQKKWSARFSPTEKATQKQSALHNEPPPQTPNYHNIGYLFSPTPRVSDLISSSVLVTGTSLPTIFPPVLVPVQLAYPISPKVNQNMATKWKLTKK